MVTCADSSFLVSLYVADTNTASAHKFVRQNLEPIHLKIFSKSETQHAMRMLAFRGNVPHEVTARGLLTFEHDQQEGLYEMLPLRAEDLFQKASQLSNHHALEFGVRYLDLLHVASALLLNARHFLTFDLRQRKFAAALGLKVKI